ncbi:hypothetical protein SDC9_126013 [bioreactor metagenome]|uniref:CD-NTase-associated protein 12/Pycsar effector protein TIR domain-containing protein n=1 Tax=bioreactor metagenome TaxID=1076179 RepID=A0A645CQ22_9ZZZZ
MEYTFSNCILCGIQAKHYIKGVYDETHIIDCPNCRMFSIDDRLMKGISVEVNPIERSLLSGYIREVNDMGDNSKFIGYDTYKEFLNSYLVPSSIVDKESKLLSYFYKHTRAFGESVSFDPSREFAACYSFNESECLALINVLAEHGYILNANRPYKLTFKGVERAEEIRKIKHETKHAFVAMWFSTEMKSVYDDSIKDVVESTGYIPFRVDNHQHNNDITDEIIAGIRSCRFMIADMTGYRGGVYFEAGFAKGLGKQVIFTCRKDWFDGEIDGAVIVKERVHFDVNHQNIIVWETQDELKKKLSARIRATIL